MNYTKGEWKLKVSKTGWQIGSEHHLIAYYASTQNPEAEANAHLIAAAPDMYEALKFLVAWDASYDDAALISKACSYARKAIAKVEGK